MTRQSERGNVSECQLTSADVSRCLALSVPSPSPSPTKSKNTPLPPKGDDGEKPKRTRKEKTTDPYTLDFEQSWLIYPRKDGKRKAFEAWQKAIKRNMPVADMPAHIENRMYEPDWRREEGRFVPHMATWLNGDGWLDEGAKIPPHNMDEEPVFVDFYEDTGGVVVRKPGEVRQ